MFDSGLVFFNAINITTNINSPTIDIPRFDKLWNTRSLSLIICYAGGLFSSRTYQLIIEQSMLPTFTAIVWVNTITFTDSTGYYGSAHANREILLTTMPIHARYLRARWVVSGATPRLLNLLKLYLTIK